MFVLFAAGCVEPVVYDTAIPIDPPVVRPVWLGDSPVILGGDGPAGRPLTLTVSGLHEGTAVKVYASFLGKDSKTCPSPGACFNLAEAVFVGDAVGGTNGLGSILWEVPQEASAGPIWYQALAVDPEGARKFSSVAMRTIGVAQVQQQLALTPAVLLTGSDTPVLVSNGYTGAVAWADVNQDWWPDLVVSNGSGEPHALFVNQGDGTFSDQSAAIPKPDPRAEDAGVIALDVDVDGRVDLLFPVDSPTWDVDDSELSGGPNLLYRNLGGGLFEEVASSWGLVDPRGARNSLAAAADRDGDGDIDVFLGTWSPGVNSLEQPGDRLLDGSAVAFVEAQKTSGLLGFGRDTSAALWLDVDQNGAIDLLNTLHGVPSLHVHLSDRSPVFELIDGGGPSAPAYGLANGDFDGDGLWDLYVWGSVSGATLAGGQVFRGLGNGNFAAQDCVAFGGCLGHEGGGAVAVDLDRDGWDDLVAGGPDGGLIASLNDGAGRLVAHWFGAAGCSDVAGADVDGDLDVDLASWSSSNGAELLLNDQPSGNMGVQVGLVSHGRVVTGALVEFVTPAGRIRRQVGGLPIVDGGVGIASSASVAVTWPDGTVDEGVAPVGDLVLIEKGIGILAESLEGSASWSASTGSMSVTATSNYGGRTELSTSDAIIEWDVSTASFRWAEVVKVPAAEITVRSKRGAVVALPVVILP